MSESQVLQQVGWMRAKDARKRLGIHETTLWRWRRNGTIPAAQVGGIWFYNVADVERRLTEAASGEDAADE